MKSVTKATAAAPAAQRSRWSRRPGLRRRLLVAGAALLVVLPVGTADLAGSSTAQASEALPWSSAGTGLAAARAAAGNDWWQVQPRAPRQLELLSARQVRPRLHELVFRTPLLPTPNTVRVLLPREYDRSAARYSALYLLHGCCNGTSPSGARNWTDTGDAERLTAGTAAVVVMPDGGNGGMWSDWADGSRRYESYVADQLLPWVDTHVRTVPTRERRGIAGLSMGGFGATHLAARRPDLFSFAGSFSGIVDLLDPPVHSSAFVEALARLEGGSPGDVFGDRVREPIGWHAQNPGDLAVNLSRQVPPLLEFGEPGRDPVEATAALENRAFERKLRDVGIAPTVVPVPDGGHDYAVWNDGLRRYLETARRVWGGGVPAPDGFTYTSTDTSFAAYGYRVRLTRPVREFATLADVTVAGFRLTGSGAARVTTAPRYRPGAVHQVRVDGVRRPVTADRNGRLSVSLDLGVSASDDQYAPTDSGPRPARTVQVVVEELR